MFRKRFSRSIAFTVVSALVMATAALAGTGVDSGDVGLVGSASAAPGAVLVRAGASDSFDLGLTADDGSFPVAQCGQAFATASTAYTVSSTGLAGTTGVQKFFTCPWSNNVNGAQSLTWTANSVSASADAPLGFSDYAITFGAAGNMVVLGNQVTLSAGFVAPHLFVAVHPRNASGLAAAAGVGDPTTEIDLSWTLSPDDADISGYIITRDGTDEISAANGESSYTDEGLESATEYCYTIKARYTDLSSNDFDSTESASVCATTDAAPTLSINGFYAPVDMGIVNYAKGGSTVPLKFEVFDGDTEITSTDVVSYFTQKIDCAGGVGDAIEQYTTGSTSLRYDSTSGQFIFNWKSLKAPGSCYRVTLAVAGAEIYADFQLK